MPKVETSLKLGGDNLRTKQRHVSSMIGSSKLINKVDLDVVNFRNKRDLTSFNEEIENPTPRRRVVKKLIRVQPIYNNNNLSKLNEFSDNDVEANTEYNHEATTRKRRKRRRKLVIKKKRKLLNNSVNINLGIDDHLQQATKPRRKVVITRKRLLPNPNKTAAYTETSTAAVFTTTENHRQSKELDFLKVEEDETNEASTENLVDSEDEDEIDSEEDLEDDEEDDDVDEDEEEDTSSEIDDDEDSYEDDEDNDIPDESTEIISAADVHPKQLPDYEPFFPELNEPLDAPVLLLKTTVVSSVEQITKTFVTSRLRTYTFIVTRVHGDEQIVTSTTEVKPQTKTSTVTESLTKFTTLTLLDFDATSTLTTIPNTIIPTLDNPHLNHNQDHEGRAYEEARYNLATRVMSNGVEVIVAGDKSTLPGEPDIKRVLPSTIYKPVTLKPSTLSDHMMMMLPQDSSNIEDLSSSLYPNQFVTKTCLTTFTYLTTYLEGSTTTVSSHEQVVSNIATEERNTGKILPTPAMGITLTQYPNLSVGIFHTTYTYLNTILDGEQPLVVSSKHTVTNTVTAPDDYLSLLHPTETQTALKDTNTYYSTITLEKTLYEGKKSSVISTNEVVTQVVITESVPPKATSVMTSYIALDIEDPDPNSLSEYTTTDVVKTYFVTYTYYNTMLENGNTVVKTNISTSSDVVTEKLYLHPKKSSSIIQTTIRDDKKKHKIDLSGENFHILATKSYLTTFTYFTTLLQEENPVSPTIISSRSKVVENIVTETINPQLLEKKHLNVIKNELNKGSSSVITIATLQDGQKLEITAVAEKIKPTKVLPIEKTKLPETTAEKLTILESSTPSVITGSTIVFIDDDPFAPKSTPFLEVRSTVINSVSSEIVKKTKVATSTTKIKRGTKSKTKNHSNSINPTKASNGKTKTTLTSNTKQKNKDGGNKKQPQGGTKITTPPNQVSDLLGLGSINMNHLQALTPVLNAMAGLIQTNLKSTRRNDANQTSESTEKPTNKEDKNVPPPATDTQNRSPIYIPVGGLADDFEIAESQNIATFHLQETVPNWKEPPKDQVVLGKPTHETSLINGGIPISPGEVITANSDVIVGKPGRILPRIPAIPLNEVSESEIPIGMKPPPVPGKPWPKRKHEYKHIPVNNIRNEKPNVVHAPNNDDYFGPPPPNNKHVSNSDYFISTSSGGGKDDYVGPPPNPDFPSHPPKREKPIIHAPNANDYVGPPPPLVEKNRDNKHNHIPLTPLRNEYRPKDQNYALNQNHYVNIPINAEVYNQQIQNLGELYNLNEINYGQNINNQQLVYAQSENNYGTNQLLNEVNHEANMANLRDAIQKNYESAAKESFPVYAKGQASMILPSIPIGTDFNVSPSILKDPLIVPEVIERSTGQPLLVNIQPSQVAYVNIPYNRTTALIYGGSSEPHKNGEYFDDPSPYPEPEFSGIESFNNGVPQFASVYHDTPNNNQKQVNGVIKVGSQLISVDPSTSENQNVPLNISPSKPTQEQSNILLNYANNHEINVNVPPISFGMVQQGQDFNAHVINHGDVQFQVPPVQYEVVNQDSNNNNRPVENIPDLRPPIKTNPAHKPKYPHPPKRQQLRPRPRPEHKPTIGLAEYMTPPPYKRTPPSPNRPQTPFRPNQKPQVIPLTPDSNPPQNKENQYYNIPNIVNQNLPTYSNIEDDDDGDLINDDGEVIQESNSRPLRPGQIPFEILKATTSTTTNAPKVNIRFPDFKFPINDNEVEHYRPILNKPDTSTTIRQPEWHINNDKPVRIPQAPIVRPENQQTNQIINVDINNNKPVVHREVVGTSNHDINIQFPPYKETTNVFNTKQHLNNGEILKLSPQEINDQLNQESHKQGEWNVNKSSKKGTVSSDVTLVVVPSNSNNGHFNKNNLISVLNKERVTLPPDVITQRYEPFTEYTIPSIFSINTKSPIKEIRSTTQAPRPVTYRPRPEFTTKNSRPKITSLPIDTHTTSPVNNWFSQKEIEQPNSQTEKPFSNPNPSQPTNEINIKQPTYTYEYTTQKVPIIRETTVGLNTGEITIGYSNITTEVSDMEMLKPPPPPAVVPEVPLKQPDTNMQPPKIEINSPGGIKRVPSLNTEAPLDQEAQGSSSKPFIPEPSEDMVPPPKTTSDEEVVGLSPPPMVSTHKPRITNKHVVPTEKPVFSLDEELSKVPIIFEQTTTSTTERNPVTKQRRPFTRRPGYRRTTTSTTTTTPVSTTESSTVRNKPTYPVYNVINRNKTREPTTTTEKIISPSPTLQSKPSMEVIIGNPNLSIEEDEPVPKEITTTHVEISGSEDVIRETVTERTSTLQNKPTMIFIDGTKTNTRFSNFAEVHTKESTSTLATHHAGNEIKIVDDPTTTTRKVLPTVKESKTNLPTRYITHTKTSTVTITKTTVVKTLGGPPSTLTILVTKTEKSTIVDTVTEFHTLVKPTSIVETVTTTIKNSGSSLYPNEVYGSRYPSIQIQPTLVEQAVVPTTLFDDLSEEDLEDFIINETDPPIIEEEPDHSEEENESIFVVMTDKNKGSVIKVPNSSHETQERDEMLANNEVNNVLLGGVLIANPPSLDGPNLQPITQDRCEPECKASRNELCQKVEGVMRCICRPGFARMFPDRPCIPTYTYSLRVNLDKLGKEGLLYEDELSNQNSTEFLKLATVAHEAIDRMVMQSDLRDIYHGVHIHSFEPSDISDGVVSRFYLQLSDNIDENRLEDVFKKYLRNNNFSLGGTEVYSSRQTLDELKALDFDECNNSKFHDCSENAQCFNLKGTYTCSCKEGYTDMSENRLYPGRVCSAEQIGCERCNFHGTCYSRGDDQVLCECFQWYSGESCHINLKVLLIGLVTLGTILLILLMVCVILTCVRRKPRKAGVPSAITFLPQRVSNGGNRSTIDRRAMIQDTSSEDSRSETNTLPYVAKKKPKGALKKTSRNSVHLSTADLENGENTLSYSDQKDRSLTVMIPRAKYHPASPTSPLMNYTTFDARKPSVPSIHNAEAKLLSYLDAGPSPNKSDNKRKYSNAPSETYLDEKPGSRKTSGALISAGFEVSATVVNNMGTLREHNTGTLLTTCGTEADRSENATLIQKISADLLSSSGTHSQFNTFRKSLVDEDIDPMCNWLEIAPRITTVSESRSFDETTIPPPMKSFGTNYDSKPSSQHQNDEAHTMAERDLGSTFLLPHTHLYKPDRGSDISGFESL